MTAPPTSLRGRTAVVVVTRHRKGAVIGPVLEAALGVAWRELAEVDTDRFGTFSGEVPRTGTALDAAMAKIAAAFAAAPDAELAVASEGSFGPAPGIPWVASGHELVVLADREGRVRAVGRDATFETNFASLVVRSGAEAEGFLTKVGLPEHGVLVTAAEGGRPRPDRRVVKGLVSLDEARATLAEVLATHGEAALETDMRAHLNPTRRRAIARAAEDAARRAAVPCPGCGVLGFGRERLVPGLPCGDCGTPTGVPRAEELACGACPVREERPLASAAHAGPERCPRCNP